MSELELSDEGRGETVLELWLRYQMFGMNHVCLYLKSIKLHKMRGVFVGQGIILLMFLLIVKMNKIPRVTQQSD